MTQLTMLNSMASADFEESLRRQAEWGVDVLDVRDAVFGKWLRDVSLDEAHRAADLIAASPLDLYCLSTGVFFTEIEQGRENFEQKHGALAQHSADQAVILRPQVVRIAAAQLTSRRPGETSTEVIRRDFPWVIDSYRRTIDTLADAGFATTIENENASSLLSSTEDFLEFFDALDRPDSVKATWDVQNQWSTGVFPSVEGFDQIKHLVGYVHVKGGAADHPGGPLARNVALEEADWPVEDIVRAVVASGVSPVIALNPPQHGRPVPGYDYAGLPLRDLNHLRSLIERISHAVPA